MSLDERLRSTLDEEAERRPVPRVDIDRLISGGRARRRRRSVTRMGVVAASLLVVGAGYGVALLGSDASRDLPDIADGADTPLAPRPYEGIVDARIEPGTYRKFVGSTPQGGSITADLAFEDPGWVPTGQPAIPELSRMVWAGVGVFEPVALAGGRSGCSTSEWSRVSRVPADTPRALARQLSRLPRSTVDQPTSSTTAFGRKAYHLRLLVEDRCPPEVWYKLAEAEGGELGLSRSEGAGTRVVDLWTVDVGGAAVVVAVWYEIEASNQLVASATRVGDSITFAIGE